VRDNADFHPDGWAECPSLTQKPRRGTWRVGQNGGCRGTASGSATVVHKDFTRPQIYMPVLELTAVDLHARYGDPNVERFLVRPGIKLLVPYSLQRRVCEMIVEPE